MYTENQNTGYVQQSGYNQNTGYVQQPSNNVNTGYVQQPAYNQQANMQTYVGASQQLQTAKSSNDAQYMSFHGFVNPQEKIVATLRNGIVDNIISGEGFRDEDAILTDRRLYYNHTNGFVSKVRVEEKIDIRDITGTKLVDNDPVLLKIIAIIMVVLGVISGVLNTGIVGFLTGLTTGAFWTILYYISLKKHLRVEYAGGCIKFSVKNYKLKNVQMFQCAIHSIKDSIG